MSVDPSILPHEPVVVINNCSLFQGSMEKTNLFISIKWMSRTLVINYPETWRKNCHRRATTTHCTLIGFFVGVQLDCGPIPQKERTGEKKEEMFYKLHRRASTLHLRCYSFKTAASAAAASDSSQALATAAALELYRFN